MKKTIKILILIISIIISNIIICKLFEINLPNMTISYIVNSKIDNKFQIYYDLNENWNEVNSVSVYYQTPGSDKKLKYRVPKDSATLRFDFGENPTEMTIKEIKLSYLYKNLPLNIDKFINSSSQNDIGSIKKINSETLINVSGNDPYLVYKINKEEFDNLFVNKKALDLIFKISMCVFINIFLFMLYKRAHSIVTLLAELYNNKILIWNLAKNDFKTKYAGSYLGITWAFIQPIVTILIFWFVFEFGLKASAPIPNVPFIVWFVSGIIPWFFFQDALNSATNSMMEYSYLVKKVVFKISILPIIKIFSSMFVHVVFLCFLIFIGMVYGYYPTRYTIQVVYYSFCTFSIALAISYTTASIVIFFRDLTQIISIVLQVGMWMTPIMWSYTMIPERFRWIVKLNPMFYIVEGYRDTFINHIWFFEKYFHTIYFWVITFGIFIIGAVIFRKLKPHFADVL